MSKKEQCGTKRIDLEYPYGHSITLRRSSMSKKDWEYIVQKFGISQAPSEYIRSVTIEGEDDFGHLLLSVIVDT